jgi:hypothetical protein
MLSDIIEEVVGDLALVTIVVATRTLHHHVLMDRGEEGGSKQCDC